MDVPANGAHNRPTYVGVLGGGPTPAHDEAGSARGAAPTLAEALGPPEAWMAASRRLALTVYGTRKMGRICGRKRAAGLTSDEA